MQLNRTGMLDTSQWSTRYVVEIDDYIKASERILSLDTAIGDWFSGTDTADFIVDAKYFPVDFSSYDGATAEVDNLVIGESAFPASDFSEGKMLILDFNYTYNGYNQIKSAPLKVSKYYNQDKDFVNYQLGIELFIPYVGFVRLNPVDVLDKYVRVFYVLDISSGKATAVLFKYDSLEAANNEDNGIILSQHSCILGTPLTSGGQITTGRHIARAVSLIGTVVGGIAGGAAGATVATTVTSGTTVSNTWYEKSKTTGRMVQSAKYVQDVGGKTRTTTTEHKSIKPPVDIGIGILEGIGAQSQHYRGNASGGGDLTWYELPQSLILIRTVPTVDVPDDYYTLYGYPCNKSFWYGKTRN